MCNLQSESLSKIDLSNDSVITIPLSFPPNRLAFTPTADFLYVTGAAKVTVFQMPTDSVVKTIPVGNGPRGITITPNGAWAYVANSGSSTVSVIKVGRDPRWLAVKP